VEPVHAYAARGRDEPPSLRRPDSKLTTSYVLNLSCLLKFSYRPRDDKEERGAPHDVTRTR